MSDEFQINLDKFELQGLCDTSDDEWDELLFVHELLFDKKCIDTTE